MKCRLAGDSLVILELGTTIDPLQHARVVQLAAAVSAASLPGVTDVVPSYGTIGIHFQPLVTDLARLQATVQQVDASLPDVPVTGGVLHEIPVQYGGDDGPDLADIAAWAGCSEDAVVARHSEVEYRVYVLGFVPGFAYLGTVDPTIAAPRRRVPRDHVPAGSVGIAGAQTGIYPSSTPGGWQLIGRTSTVLFDRGRPPGALLAPGDRVRFIPV
ncbi:MAG: 5-oxoprolinase subunit PxpB [Acidobacteria bacterium]|nr:5-oxoprolinase subunit PxpB [Acidobacteriota bacterium]